MTPNQLIRQAEKNSGQHFLWVLAHKHTRESILELRDSLILEPDTQVIMDACGGFNVKVSNSSTVFFHKGFEHDSHLKGQELDGCVIEDMSSQDFSVLHDILYPAVTARDGWISGTCFKGQALELDVIIRHAALKPFIADIEGTHE